MKPYLPEQLPLPDLDHHLLFPLIGKANAALARYDGLLQGIPNSAVMRSPLTTHEAVLSSKIEGTQATVDEVLEHDAGLEKEGEKGKDIQEISNYRLALFKGSEHLQDYPIRLGLVRELHKVLMDSVRGHDKSPGEFRQDQNWIGPPGCSMEEATFVPPTPHVMQDSLRNWETYLDQDDSDVLLQTAIVHAQFELIHPFKDGNGRIGRILIPLFLFQKCVLAQPMFYLSEYFERHRDEYIHRLGAISQESDWSGWITFFLKAITDQAEENANKVQAIMRLYQDMKSDLQTILRSKYSVNLLDAIFNRPVFKTTDPIALLSKEHGIHNRTVSRMLQQLKGAGILREIKPARGRADAVLCFPALINLIEGRRVL